MIAAQSSVRRASLSGMLGTTENASHETEVTKKPVQRKRSKRRPSTAKRVPVSSATRKPATMKIVARTSFNSGSEYGVPEGRVGKSQGEGDPEQGEQQHQSPEETFEAIVMHHRQYRHNLNYA